MKPPPFDYRAPTTLDEVLALLAEYGSDARVIAGGQSLVPLMNLRMARPEVLIDLNRCGELMRIDLTGGGVSYGAMVRQSDAQYSEVTQANCPLVSKTLAHAGPIAVRNRATVGGTLAHADRAAELPGAAVALNATMVIASASGTREVPALEFFQGDMTTSVDAGEMLKAAIFPKTDAGAFTGFYEVGIRREGVAIVGLAAHLTRDDAGSVADAGLAVIGVESAPVRLAAVEAALKRQRLTPELIAELGTLASDGVDPVDDAQVRAGYRKHVAGALVKQALEEAMAGRSS